MEKALSHNNGLWLYCMYTTMNQCKCQRIIYDAAPPCHEAFYTHNLGLSRTSSHSYVDLYQTLNNDAATTNETQKKSV